MYVYKVHLVLDAWYSSNQSKRNGEMEAVWPRTPPPGWCPLSPRHLRVWKSALVVSSQSCLMIVSRDLF